MTVTDDERVVKLVRGMRDELQDYADLEAFVTANVADAPQAARINAHITAARAEVLRRLNTLDATPPP